MQLVLNVRGAQEVELTGINIESKDGETLSLITSFYTAFAAFDEETRQHVSSFDVTEMGVDPYYGKDLPDGVESVEETDVDIEEYFLSAGTTLADAFKNAAKVTIVLAERGYPIKTDSMSITCFQIGINKYDYTNVLEEYPDMKYEFDY